MDRKSDESGGATLQRNLHGYRGVFGGENHDGQFGPVRVYALHGARSVYSRRLDIHQQQPDLTVPLAYDRSSTILIIDDTHRDAGRAQYLFRVRCDV